MGITCLLYTSVEEEREPQQTADTQEAVEEIFDTETISLDEEEDAKEVNSFTEYAEEKVKELQPEGTEEEDLEKGDINPYTGHEYLSLIHISQQSCLLSHREAYTN